MAHRQMEVDSTDLGLYVFAICSQVAVFSDRFAKECHMIRTHKR